MKFNKTHIILIFVFFISNVSNALNYADSLETLFYKTNDTILKIKYLIKIGESYENVNPNTSLLYYDKANFLAKKINDKKNIAATFFKKGSAYEILSNYDKALQNYKKGLKAAIQNNDTVSIASCYNGVGNVYYYLSKKTKAITNYKKSINYFSLLKNSQSQVGTVNHNIGMILQDMGQHKKAIAYYNKALEELKASKNYGMLSTCYNSVGTAYNQIDSVDKAIDAYKKALKYAKMTNDLFNQELIYANFCELYIDNDRQKALQYIIAAETIANKIDDKMGLADIYVTMARFYVNEKDYYKAKKYALKSLKYAKEINSIGYIRNAYKILAKANKNLGNYKEAYSDLTNYMEYKDSILEKNKAADIANIEAKYQNEKKQLKIENLEKQSKLDNEKFQKQRILIISFVIGSILILVFLIFIINTLRKIREKNKLLNSKNEEIVAQRDEISTQRDAVVKQKQKIEEINNELSQSIEYAKRIQSSMFPNVEVLKNNFSDYMVFFKPKDVVSGDFYWWTKVDNNTIVVAVDCTGHGVPGAFMSMLGISLLHEIVNKEKIIDTKQILQRLRQDIITALKQEKTLGAQKDGMDMAVISINHDTNIAEFSGANNPLFLIKNEELKIKDDESSAIKLYDNSEFRIQNSKFRFYEVKPDKMPVAIYIKMKDFNKTKLQLDKGDQIYMFSDGFADQFGGPKGKKFKYKPFKKMLLNIADKPMNEQKNIIDNTFINWKDDYAQVDDVLIIGIKI